MKKKSWNPRGLWESLKRMVTKNLWLKILSLILATTTYSALKDKTEYQPRASEEMEAEIKNLKHYISKTAASHERHQNAKKTDDPAEENKNNPKKNKGTAGQNK